MSANDTSAINRTAARARKCKKPTTKVTHFLSQTYHMVMQESEKGLVRWGAGEDTFIVEDAHKFIKILPLYFKTKNFASFVRQLNMYGFHKVKNDKSYHEFRHAQFRKGCYDELIHIKRKNFVVDREAEQLDKDVDCEELARLRDKLDNTKSSLEAVTQQNMQLISNNKEVASQLYGFKQEYEQRLSKFFFMFYFIINSKSESLLAMLKRTLAELGIAYADDATKSTQQRTVEAYSYISEEVLLSSNYDHAVVSKLLNAFTLYFSQEAQSIASAPHSAPVGSADDEAEALRKRRCTFLSTEAPDVNVSDDGVVAERFEYAGADAEYGCNANDAHLVDGSWDIDRIYDERADVECSNSCFGDVSNF